MIHCLGLVFKYLAKIAITTKGTQGKKELMVKYRQSLSPEDVFIMLKNTILFAFKPAWNLLVKVNNKYGKTYLTLVK